MSHVLYLQNDPKDKKGLSAPLLTDRSYDAFFCDKLGKREKLNACLESLQSGDTLYVKQESALTDDLAEVVAILVNLAGRGVNVWIERLKCLFEAESSPFLSCIGVAEAEALKEFHTFFVSERLKQGRMESTTKMGRPRKELPEGFNACKKDWLEGKTTSTEAAARCGMAVATFRKWAKLLA